MLKKSVKPALIATIIINAICLITNLICAYTINTIPFGRSMHGGECIVHTGFGISLLETFPMTYNGETSNGYTQVNFDLRSLLCSLVIIFITSLIIVIIINKIKSKKVYNK